MKNLKSDYVSLLLGGYGLTESTMRCINVIKKHIKLMSSSILFFRINFIRVTTTRDLSSNFNFAFINLCKKLNLICKHLTLSCANRPKKHRCQMDQMPFSLGVHTATAPLESILVFKLYVNDCHHTGQTSSYVNKGSLTVLANANIIYRN